MLQQVTFPVLDRAATAVVLARGMGAKTILALRRRLEALHFRVVVAGTPESALAACGKQAVLLLAPAGEEGGALFWRLRRLQAGDVRPRCIALMEETAADAALVLDMLAAGADDCLVWPVNDRLLAQRLGLVMAKA